MYPTSINILILEPMCRSIGPVSKSQNLILQGLKGRYPIAIGIAHGKINATIQDLKSRDITTIIKCYGMGKAKEKQQQK